MAARRPQIRRSKLAAPRGLEPKSPYETAAKIAEWALKVAAFFFIVSLAYMLYGIFSGHLSPAPEDRERVAHIFALFTKVFSVSAIVVAIALFIRFYHEVSIVCLGGLISLLTWLVIPMIVGGRVSRAYAGRGTIASNLITDMKWCGAVVFIVVVSRIIVAIVERIRRPPEPKRDEDEKFQEALGADGRPQLRKKSLAHMPMWAKCWQLPYCHDALRNVCPAFEKKRSCWHLKRGCNCDPTMLDKLVQIRAATRGVSVQQQITAKKYVRDELEAGAQHKPGEQLIPCKKCPIYLEHQRQKYQLANPIAIVACLVFFYFFAPMFEVGYKTGLIGVDKFTRTFAFTEHKEGARRTAGRNQPEPHGPDWKPLEVRTFYTRKPVITQAEQARRGYQLATWLGNELNERTVFWIIYVVACVFFLSYVLKILEWAILKKKW